MEFHLGWRERIAFTSRRNILWTVSAIAGNQEYPWYVHSTEGGFYNHPFNAGWGAQSILEALVDIEPDLARDSYLTLGFDQGENAIELSSVIGNVDPFQAFVPDGGGTFVVNDLLGSAYYHPFQVWTILITLLPGMI